MWGMCGAIRVYYTIMMYDLIIDLWNEAGAILCVL